MPSINEVLERTNRVRPDAVDDETKAAWLIELDGQLFREVILRHRVHPGPCKTGPAGVCPVCGGWGLDEDGEPNEPVEGEKPTPPRWSCVLDFSYCEECGWTELPKYPKRFPEDGDAPELLVPAPYDGLYDLYIWSKVDFTNREMENYNNSAAAYNAALDEWKKAYNRAHMPIGARVFRIR